MRKIIQISTALIPEVGASCYEQITVALCDDNSLWRLEWSVKNNGESWNRLPDIPQDDNQFNDKVSS